MTTTLITGANKGLGYETARRLIEAGHTVWMGARDTARGQQAADALGGMFVQLDVTSDVSVAAAAETVGAAGGLDVLINNAGITGSHSRPEDLTGADALAVYQRRQRRPHDQRLRARSPRIGRPDHRQRDQRPGVVRCRARSRADRVDGQRAALHLVEVGGHDAHGAVRKAFPEMRINAADPGYTATDLNGNSGTQTVQEGTDAIVDLATRGGGGPTGTFIDRSGVAPF